MNNVSKAYSIGAVLLLLALPTASYHDYNTERSMCDIVYDHTCILDGIDDLSSIFYLDLESYYEPIYGLKFTSCEVVELTTSTVQCDSCYGSITNIDLSNGQIKMVHKFHFTVEQLFVANLSRNEIENLDASSIFEAHPQLHTIDLSFNRITTIGADAFNGLNQLKVLHLNDNRLNVINEFMFTALVRLKHLELSGNFIEKFENDPFVVLVDLEKINLEKNNFSEFNFDIFESNGKLHEISLGDNEEDDFLSLIGNVNFTAYGVQFSKIIQSIASVPALYVSIKNSKLTELVIRTETRNVLVTNSSLTKLSFNGNDSALTIGNFSKNSLTGNLSFENCAKLQVLDLSSNNVQSIHLSNQSLMIDLNLSKNNLTTTYQSMTNLSQLRILDLSFNCIENFEPNTFQNMISLEVLNLRRTCFKSLNYGTFSFQTKLRVLDISFNDLNSFDLDVLSNQAKLEDLLIDGNNLTNVYSMDLIGTYFLRLRSVGLTHNNWNCKTLSNLIKKLLQTNIKVFVETSVTHTTNVRGIGCTNSNSSRQTVIVPKNPMSMDHTAYMSKIEKVNVIVDAVNKLTDTQNHRESLANSLKDLRNAKSQLKIDFIERINQLKTFGKGILNKLRRLNDGNFEQLMKMKVVIDRLNRTNNEKNDLIAESIDNLKDKLKLIELNKENYSQSSTAVSDKRIRMKSDSKDDLGTLRTLEIILIAALFVLLTLALYYTFVYC